MERIEIKGIERLPFLQWIRGCRRLREHCGVWDQRSHWRLCCMPRLLQKFGTTLIAQVFYDIFYLLHLRFVTDQQRIAGVNNNEVRHTN